MHSRLMITRLLGVVVVVVVVLFGSALAVASPHRTAVLQGLDKVTARVSTLSVPIGATVRFGTLEVIVRHCNKRPPEEAPESAAFVDIWQARSGEPSAFLFRGWMFASSPALNALEHPVYDIWVLDCEDSGEDAGMSLRLEPSMPGIPALNLQ